MNVNSYQPKGKPKKSIFIRLTEVEAKALSSTLNAALSRTDSITEREYNMMASFEKALDREL